MASRARLLASLAEFFLPRATGRIGVGSIPTAVNPVRKRLISTLLSACFLVRYLAVQVGL